MHPIAYTKQFLGLPDEFTKPDHANVAVLLAPYERTSTFGLGSGTGPEAIIDASYEAELFDCDGFDPSVIPATGTPEPGGLSWLQVNALFRELYARRRVVGLDVTELAPIEGIHHPQFMIAKLIYRILGYRFRAGA